MEDKIYKQNLYNALKHSASKSAKRKALIFEKNGNWHSITCRKLVEKIDAFSSVLFQKNINRGDNVAILLKNSPEFVISAFACFKLGATIVPLNFFLSLPEILYLLNDCRAKILITGDDFKDISGKIKEEANNLEEIINLDFSEIKETGYELPFQVEVEPDENAAILYTSGTTGHPKGAILTHRNFLSNVSSCHQVIEISRKDRVLCFLPLFHSFAFTTTLLLPLFSGASVVILKHLIKGKKFLKLLFSKRINFFVSIPQVYNLFLKVPALVGRILLFRLKFLVSGADTLPEKTFIQFKRKFGKTILEGYGLTEAAPVVTLNPPDKPKPGTIGKPLPGIELKIVDENGRKLSTGEIGEIIIRGENVMKDYFELPHATKGVLKDGWLYTGDLGFVDDEGYVHIAERKKDMFVSKGLNVYPKEIENVIKDIPEVEEVSVVGVDYKNCVVPVAFLKKCNVSEKTIISFCRKRLANYKVPKKVVFLEELPKNATGKILKKELVNFFKESGNTFQSRNL